MNTTFAQQWSRLVAQDPAKPALTWYDEAASQRIELSYKSLDNWVAKIANLLGDGHGLGPGDPVSVRLERDWREPAATLAVWVAGAQLVPEGGTILDKDELADVLGYGDRFAGPSAAAPHEVVAAEQLAAEWGLSVTDRVLGIVDGWRGWLPALMTGAGAVVWHGLDAQSAERRLASENVTVAVARDPVDGLGVRLVLVG